MVTLLVRDADAGWVNVNEGLEVKRYRRAVMRYLTIQLDFPEG